MKPFPRNMKPNVGEEPDINELVVEYLKSKSLFAAARKLKDDLLALTTGSTAAVNLFTSELELKLGVAGGPQGATAVAPLLLPSPQMSPEITTSAIRDDGIPSSTPFPLAARSRRSRPLNLVNMMAYKSELEVSRLRSRHGRGNARSRAIFHDPPRPTACEGAHTHVSHIVSCDSHLCGS